jgi:hypothetical protein
MYDFEPDHWIEEKKINRWKPNFDGLSPRNISGIRFVLFWIFKGTVSRDFLLLVFFINQFPPSPTVSSRTVSNFFENSRRYSHLKVDHRCRWHRWQMKKIFNQKIFYNFVWIVELTYIYIFAFVDTGGQPWAGNISANFRKNSKRPCYTQGLGGNWFMKKNQKQKISWHCPFKRCV